MTNDSEEQTSLVHRITIDEKLEDDLIRILIANLKNNVTTFSDDSTYWEEEEELFVRSDNYQKKIGMTRDNAKKWPWDNLYEGQVFLIGRFRVTRNRGAETTFVVDVKRRNFQCIDRLIKEHVKKKYLAALERSISDGETNQTE